MKAYTDPRPVLGENAPAWLCPTSPDFATATSSSMRSEPVSRAKGSPDIPLGYLAALHRRFGSWERALWFYNAGRVVDVPEGTRAYARRICEAGAPR